MKFEMEVIQRLTRIEEKFDSDHEVIFGHDNIPGLMENHNVLDDRVHVIETTYKTWGVIFGGLSVIAIVVGAFIAYLNYQSTNKKNNIKRESSMCSTKRITYNSNKRSMP